MSQSETAAHRELKRLALAWAQARGYRVAATEVSLPNYRFRLDVAAYRPERVHTPGGGSAVCRRGARLNGDFRPLSLTVS